MTLVPFLPPPQHHPLALFQQFVQSSRDDHQHKQRGKHAAGVVLSSRSLNQVAEPFVISLPGYRDERRIFQPGPGANSLSVSMQLKGGTLYIATAAAGALVMIDGVLLPLRTPAPITLAPGRYRVTLWADAILQSETEVEVRDQQSAVLSFK